MNNLIPILVIPIIGFILILFTKEVYSKYIALITTVITFIESLRLWFNFNYITTDFQFITIFKWNNNVSFLFGLDGISLVFVLLTTFLLIICILVSWDSITYLKKEYMLCFIALDFILIGVFSVLDILGFYVLFETILIPMFFVIGIWGPREQQKITAAYYFFFYTLIGSLLMLLAIFYIYSITGTTDYLTLLDINIDPYYQYIIFICFFASFAVKIPIFPFHLWLPYAHVEAPLAGSVILAGILIKLGAYGFIRFSLPLLPEASIYFTPFVFTLCILGIVYASLTTIRQTDLKRIIAYSSISHMAVVTLGIFTYSIIGIEGSIFLQIAHGIVSSALFIVVTLLYERHHTRIIKYYRGITLTMPLYSTIFLFFTLANIAVPLSCNFIGEFLSLMALFQVNPFICILACSSVLLSAAYALFLYNRVAFGEISIYLKHSLYSRDITRREFYILLPLIILTIFLGVYPQIVLDILHPSVIRIFI